MINLLAMEDYDPANLLDHLINEFTLKNDAALCRFLGVNAPTLCKIRKKKLAIGGDFLVRAHDVTGIELDGLRELAKIPKTKVEQTSRPLKRPVPVEE